LHVTIEYMILIPMLILQIFLFPIVATTVMNHWTDSRKTLAIKEIAGNLGSSIQQVYYSLNHESMETGSVNVRVDAPISIEGSSYRANATLRNLEPGDTSTRILDVTVNLIGTQISANTSVTLGQNVEWADTSTLMSATNSSISATKAWDGEQYVIQLGFGA
jgi:hypothetical protein